VQNVIHKKLACQVRSFEVDDDDGCLLLKRRRITKMLMTATDNMRNNWSPDQKLTRSKLYSWMLRSRSSICENTRCNSTDLRKLLLTWYVDVCNAHQTFSQPPHHNHFTALFPGLPGWAGARRETSGLYGARED